MSWGYFLDFELTVRADDWAALVKTTGAGLSKQWWGFEETGLEHYFGNTGFENTTFEKVFGWWKHGESCQKTIVKARGNTSVHLIAHLDKSGDTQVAGPIAALFEAASKVGGTGRIRLVNDGTYSGEGGVEVAIDDGRLVRSRLDDWNEISEELQAAVYPELEEEIEKYLSPEAQARTKKPEAKKPVKKVAQKSATKQRAAKKPAAKRKAAAKEKPPTKRKSVAKNKPAVKNKPAKNTPAKNKPAAKNTPAKNKPAAKKSVGKKTPAAKKPPVAQAVRAKRR